MLLDRFRSLAQEYPEVRESSMMAIESVDNEITTCQRDVQDSGAGRRDVKQRQDDPH